jgi:hypothetical protein
MKSSLLKAIGLGLTFVLLVWVLGLIRTFIADILFLPGMWLAQLISPGGVHSDFLGAFFGYTTLVMNVVFYGALFTATFEIIRRRRAHHS